MNKTYSELIDKFPELEFLFEHQLKQYTTVKIGGPAEIFCQTKTSDQFIDLVKYTTEKDIPTTILGWGANTLISDNGIRGLVIRNTSQEIKILEDETSMKELKNDSENSNSDIEHRWHADKEKGTFKYEFSDLNYDESDQPSILVEIDSGVSLPFAINFLIDKGITGLQWYSRIPATIGGAIYNNIHGGTHFISELVESVKIISTDGKLKTLNKNELKTGYDQSRFHNSNEIIVSVIFRLFKGDAQKAKAVATEWAIRKAIQPQKSLGCIFQNISVEQKEKNNFPTTSVGYIVDHIIKKKGYKIGDAQISEKHAAFIENVGLATATDYLKLIKLIIKETKETTGIILKPEIFFLGFKKEELLGVTD